MSRPATFFIALVVNVPLIFLSFGCPGVHPPAGEDVEPGGPVPNDNGNSGTAGEPCITNSDCSDGLFCNGAESCVGGECQPESSPCTSGQTCDESIDRCETIPECTANAHCDDGLFCNGTETCVAGECQSGSAPCASEQNCSEGADRCGDCTLDSDCDTGLFCDGMESCIGHTCQPGTPPDCDDGIACTDDSCEEATDSCEHIANDANCDDGLFCNGPEMCVDDDCRQGTPPCADDETCNDEVDACLPQSPAEALAFQHLGDVMDKFHTQLPVYTDLSAAGNHFIMLGRMSSSGDQDKVEINPAYTPDCFSGSSCIENRFLANGDNWGGWYFMNGVLEGEETQPKPNWGDYPDAGLDLIGAEALTFRAKGRYGGERVELFAFGIGRSAATEMHISAFPDSSPKASLGYVTLSNTWTRYVINLENRDLSYVLGGFGWATNARENNNQDITFYLDDIAYDKDRLEEPRFLLSYETIPSSLDFDIVLRNVAFTYDNALALIAFLARGSEDDMRRAELLADAFVYAIGHDRYFSDGRLRNAYQGGDLILFPGWRPNGRENTVRMPGWWDLDADRWWEDSFAVGSNSGNVAWAMIALLSYYSQSGGQQYLEAAKTLGNWIEAETRDARGTGGYVGGYDGWEPTGNNPTGQAPERWKSTENSIDIYVAFARLHQTTRNQVWLDRALHAKAFVTSMWDEDQGHFWTGTKEDGVTVNTEALPADVNTWALLALGNPSQYGAGISWVNGNCYVEADGFKGFDFNDDRDHVWFEGTAHMVLAFQLLGDIASADTYLAELRRAQAEAPNGNGRGLVAASADGLTTGFDWLYYNRLHIGATAWFLFAEAKYNPYWNIGIGDAIPAYEGAGTVQFAAAASSVSEGRGSATLTATRGGSHAGELTVIYTTSDGTARAGEDYMPAAGTLVFADGETSKSFGITIVNDMLVEGEETVNIALSSPSGAAVLGDPASAILTILDDDTGTAGQLQFQSSAYSVSEDEGVISLLVSRTGGQTGAVSVSYATNGGNATADSDYVGAAGTLSFAMGETSKSLTLTILDDSTVETDETVNVTLADPTGGAILGDPSMTVVTIIDEDQEAIQMVYSYGDFALTNVCTYDDNWCGYADRPEKAVVYGEMSKAVNVPSSYDKLDVMISIPCEGWGEGLAGPDGSSARIIVDDVVREEVMDDTMPYHHGAYYRYEYCDSFTNTFDVTGTEQIQLIIRMNDGARLDFEEANLRFYGN